MNRLAISGLLLFLGLSAANAAELRVLTSAALTEAAGELIPRFERATNIKVVNSFGGDDLPTRLQSGEPADLVIIWRTHVDKLTGQGLLVRGSEMDIVRSKIGVAVRVGMPKPDISSVDSLRRTLLDAKSIAYSNSISGVYVSTELFPKLGITEEVKTKSKRIVGMRVGAAVARGDADIGFQQISELLPVSGIDFVGPLPDQVQLITTFSAAHVTHAKNPSAAKTFIHFLTSRAATPVFAKRGLEPVASKNH